MQSDSSTSSEVKTTKVKGLSVHSARRNRGRKAGRKDKVTLLDPSKKLEVVEESVTGRSGLDADKLVSILTGFGEYPAKYRSVARTGQG